MLAYSPHVIDRGFRKDELDCQQIRDILELKSLPMREPDLFRAFLAWLKLQKPEERDTFKKELQVDDLNLWKVEQNSLWQLE